MSWKKGKSDSLFIKMFQKQFQCHKPEHDHLHNIFTNIKKTDCTKFRVDVVQMPPVK
jgi:hypothetical protein